MRCHIQGQGFDNKMYISELFTVAAYMHTAGFKNRLGINFAKCTLANSSFIDTQLILHTKMDILFQHVAKVFQWYDTRLYTAHTKCI